MAILNPLTRADLASPVGPFLVEALLTDPSPPHSRRWVLQQSVPDADEGLRIASRMTQSCSYRLFLGAAHGYLYLGWIENDPGSDYLVPVWIRKD